MNLIIKGLEHTKLVQYEKCVILKVDDVHGQKLALFIASYTGCLLFLILAVYYTRTLLSVAGFVFTSALNSRFHTKFSPA